MNHELLDVTFQHPTDPAASEGATITFRCACGAWFRGARPESCTRAVLQFADHIHEHDEIGWMPTVLVNSPQACPACGSTERAVRKSVDGHICDNPSGFH